MAKETRYYQTEAEQAVDNALKRGVVNQLLVMATGCHAKGTKILMSNATTKNVEDIQIRQDIKEDIR